MTEKEAKANYFDPKSFLESLFPNGGEAEIEVLLNNSNSTGNNSTVEDIDQQHGDDHDAGHKNYDYKPDVYFVIGAVSFIIFVILCLAIYKAIVMIKISLNDGIDDTVPVESQQRNNDQTGTLTNGM